MGRLVGFVIVAACAVAPSAAMAQADAAAPSEGARLFAAGKYSDAKLVFEPAFKADRRDATAAYYLGRIAMAEDRYDKAADWFETATRLDPKRADHFLWLGRAACSEAGHANVLRQPGLARKCRNAWEHTLELDPENLDARADLIQYYVRAPGILGGGTEKAFVQAEEIRKRDAMRGNLELGRLYDREKKPAEAERAFIAATAVPSDKPTAFYSLGNFYVNRAMYDKAFDLYEGMLTSRPHDPVPLFLIGRTASISKQRTERGRQALEAFLAAAPPVGPGMPTPAAAHYRLGTLFELGNDRPRARAEYQEAVRLDPKLKPAAEALQKLP